MASFVGCHQIHARLMSLLGAAVCGFLCRVPPNTRKTYALVGGLLYEASFVGCHQIHVDYAFVNGGVYLSGSCLF